jgi:hypothetical protein
MFAIGHYEEALRAFLQIEQMSVAQLWMGAIYVKLGDRPQARLALGKYLSTAQDDMGSFPGKDEEAWQSYLHREVPYRYEKDFQVFYQGLLQAGWLELLDALPDDPPRPGD